MPESPRLLDFDICRVFHGDTLVETLNLVTGDDARLTDARTPLAHSHVIADVSGLQTALDGKAASTHTHAVSDLKQSGAALNDVATWNGSSWVAAAPTGGSGVSDGDKGDITVSGGGATWTIDNGVVTAAKTSITGTPDGTKFLRDDFTWQPASGGVSDGDKGDITVSGGGAAWAIDAQAVTFAKMQNITTDRLLGRDTAASGSPEEISLNATLEFTGTAAIQRAALTGDVTAAAGSNATTLAAGSASVLNSGTLPAGRMPALTGDVTTTVGTVATTIANDAVTYAKMQNVSAISKLLGRGSGAGVGDVEEITLGTNLSMSGTTLNSTGGGGGSTSITAATVTVPYGTRDALIAVVDAAVTATSKIMLAFGAYLQTDTNDPSDAVFSVEDVGTGTFNVRARANGPESIGGPFKLNYILA